MSSEVPVQFPDSVSDVKRPYLLRRIRPAVKATELEGERSSKNPAFVDAVARKNVELTMAQILEKSAVLSQLQSKPRVAFLESAAPSAKWSYSRSMVAPKR
jgi:hypothetical protein